MPSGGRKPLDCFDNRLHGRRVVAVVENDRRPTMFQDVEPSRAGAQTAIEACQAIAQMIQRNTQAPGRGHGRQDIFNLEGEQAAVRQRNVDHRGNGGFLRALRENDHSLPFEHGPAASPAMLHHYRMFTAAAEEHYSTPTVRGHGSDQRIVRFKHRVAVRPHGLDEYAFDACQVLWVLTQEMPRWSPSAMFVTTATSQQSKPRPSRIMPPRGNLEHARIDKRVQEQTAGSLWDPRIVLVNETPGHKGPVGTGHAYPMSKRFDQAGDQSNGGCLAVHASNRGDRNPAGITIGQ